ncbi:MAG TPA: hypothetical protein VKU00_31380 [Chthonomonadaceae bacterium]|nr:hypothetical protein [Chthonomonadaceae bacterium]
MKQQVNPIMAIVAIVGVLVVVGLVIFFLNSRSESGTGAAPTSANAPAGQASGTQGTVSTKGMSPDDVVKQHMNQMPGGGK